MFFILQKDDDFNRLDIELLILQEELQKQKYTHNFSLDKISFWENKFNEEQLLKLKKCVPVGSIEFVSKYLKKVHNIDNMNPLEVPECLRLDKFLNRKYAIVDKDHLPKDGYWFIKDVSELKNFTYLGNMEYFFYPEIFDKPTNNVDTRLHLNPNHLFEVSEPMDILSEYRVCVCDDKIKGIQFYDGNPLIMPTPNEIEKIEEMVLRYSLDKTRPMSYAMDIGIIKNNLLGRDIMLIEMCPFACLGTYGLVGSFLPYMYKDGVDWYIQHNTKISKFSNF